MHDGSTMGLRKLDAAHEVADRSRRSRRSSAPGRREIATGLIYHRRGGRR